jgi:hypothetical protein
MFIAVGVGADPLSPASAGAFVDAEQCTASCVD